MKADLVSRMRRRLWIEYITRIYYLPTLALNDLGVGKEETMPPIMENICMPPFYGNDDHDDYTPLMATASHLSPKVIFEIGTAHGNSVANLCRHCPEAHIYTVNAPVEEQTGKIITFELTKIEIGRVYRDKGFEKQVTQIFANSMHLNLKDYFNEPTIDMAIIDGCHDTEFVINDFLKILPFMRSNGVIFLHDTHPSMQRHLKGSYLACVELRRRGFNIWHLQDTWWGVWRGHSKIG